MHSTFAHVPPTVGWMDTGAVGELSQTLGALEKLGGKWAKAEAAAAANAASVHVRVRPLSIPLGTAGWNLRPSWATGWRRSSPIGSKSPQPPSRPPCRRSQRSGEPA